MRVLAFTCGWISADLGLFLAGAEGSIRVPVPAFLIEHPRGRVLFDAGLHPALARRPEQRLGDRIARLFHVELAAGEDIASRLAAVEIEPTGIDWLVGSHLHFDHAGGYQCVPSARLLLQRREWEAAAEPDVAARLGFQRHDFDHGHDLVLADGQHDLFGDGAVVCLPTPGHTPGHQSLRVRLPGGDIVLTADACYLRRSLDEGVLPPVLHDAEQARRSLAQLRALRDRGARLVFGHDPELWSSLDFSAGAFATLAA